MSKENRVSLIGVAFQIIGFVKSFIEALNKRGISDKKIYALATKERGVFIEKIADSVAEFIKRREELAMVGIVEFYVDATVDYASDLKSLVRRYQRVYVDVNADNFPPKYKGKITRRIEFIRFGNKISSEGALEALDKQGYRAAELHEFLSAVAQAEHPGILKKIYGAVVLGSIWHDSTGDDCVVLYNRGSLPDLHTITLEKHEFSTSYLFPAVLK